MPLSFATLLLALALSAGVTVADAATPGAAALPDVPEAAGPEAGASYQLRMKDCHGKAKGRKGMARCEFLRRCLHGDGAGVKAPARADTVPLPAR